MTPLAPAPASHPRFWSLDALRGVCALVVFLSHWHVWSNFLPRSAPERSLHAVLEWSHETLKWFTWPAGGNHPAVICFFVLSGFCIHYPFERRWRESASSPLAWGDHFRRRFWRIMPVYWIAALLGIALVSAEALRPTGSALFVLNTFAPPEHIVARLLGVTGFYPQEVLAGNSPLNTVGVEIVVYLAYPWFHFYAVKGRWLALGLITLGLEAAGLALLAWITPFWIFNSVFMLGIFWWAGAFAAHRIVRHGTRSYARELVLAWAGFLALKTLPTFFGLGTLTQNAWGLVCVFGILQCLHVEKKSPEWCATLPMLVLRYAGRISYSLYAVHTPTMLLATWALYVSGNTSYSAQLAATLLLSLAATLVVHYGIERIFYRPHPSPLVPPRYDTPRTGCLPTQS